VQNGAPQPEQASPWSLPATDIVYGGGKVQRVVVLYTHPQLEMETLAGKAYVADLGGEILADEGDAEELRCRLRSCSGFWIARGCPSRLFETISRTPGNKLPAITQRTLGLRRRR
jgi:hypothetical protein